MARRAQILIVEDNRPFAENLAEILATRGFEGDVRSCGAHRDPKAMISATGDAIAEAFNDLRNLDAADIRQQRRQKFLDIGRKLG